MRSRSGGHRTHAVAVIGLGRFGRALALELVKAGDLDVLGIDSDRSLVDELSARLTHAVVADSTREDALRQLSVHEFDRAVVGIGGNLEASILTASLLVQFGIPNIWAKAVSEAHERILTQIGVQHVTRPEHDMGLRLAHLVRGRMQDFIEFEEGFAMVKTNAPAGLIGRTLHEARVRADHRVTVVAHHRPGEPFTYATPDTRLGPGDVVIVSGRTQDVERFSDLT